MITLWQKIYKDHESEDLKTSWPGMSVETTDTLPPESISSVSLCCPLCAYMAGGI